MPRAKTKTASSANLHIRLPADEKVAFDKAAERSGFDLTTWVRFALRRAAGLDVLPKAKGKRT